MYEVYIHVPFCLRRCGYCDFNTYTAFDMGEGASRDNYAAMAIAEMRLVKQWQYDHHIVEPAVSTVFFGGGTPTVLTPEDLGTMLHAVDDLWGLSDDAEITTEANPDTVDYDSISALRDQGFTRISLGMQSAVPRVLRTLDRTHTPANVTAAVQAAQRVGLRSSVDLIYGTPGEGLGDWRYSVQAALDLGVDHISAYALTLEPTTKMGRQVAQGSLPHPDDDDEATKYTMADTMFAAAGLTWYEVSNWARPGCESRHNLGYWRNVDWAGIGPGAHSHYSCQSDAADVTRATPPGETSSTTVDAANEHADAAGIRSWDILHPRAWAHRIAEQQVPWEGHEIITHDENIEELIMLGLRLREGLDLNRLVGAMGRPIAMSPVRELEHEGLVDIMWPRLVATRRGRLLNDAVIQRMFTICGL